MDRDPTTARFAAGRLARLRAARARPAARGGDGASSPVPPAAVADGDEAGPGLGDLTRLTAALTRHGHDVRVADRCAEGTIPDTVARQGLLVLEDIVTVLVRCAGSDQRISIRIRTEDEQLLIAVQTLPAGDRPKPIALAARDEDVIRRRAESAGGRATVRTTHGGNWIAMARLPLRA